jgi:hypothetical protein
MAAKKLLERMLVDETSLLPQIVSVSEKIFRIDKTTGEPIFLAPRSKLSHTDLIAIGLLSKYMAHQLEIVDASSVTPSELSKVFKLKKMIAGARLNDLKIEGVARLVKWGEYRVSLPDVLRYFQEKLLPKIERQSGGRQHGKEK